MSDDRATGAHLRDFGASVRLPIAIGGANAVNGRYGRVDLDREAKAVRADGARIQRDGSLGEAGANPRVAVYVAACERIDKLSAAEVVDIVRQGLDTAAGNSVAVRDLARDVLWRHAGMLKHRGLREEVGRLAQR